MAEKIGEGVFPNWIGPQRFGSGRPVTPIVGRHVVSGDWKSAVMDYLSLEGDENDDARQFIAKIRDSGINSVKLEEIPQWLGFERDILKHLQDNPDDWVENRCSPAAHSKQPEPRGGQRERTRSSSHAMQGCASRSHLQPL